MGKSAQKTENSMGHDDVANGDKEKDDVGQVVSLLKTDNGPTDSGPDADAAWDLLKNNIQSRSGGGKKFYYFDLALYDPRGWTPEFRAKFDKAPPQVKGIIAYMAANACGPAHATQGKLIVDGAKETGLVKSKIESAVLFAYYARKMEELGVCVK